MQQSDIIKLHEFLTQRYTASPAPMFPVGHAHTTSPHTFLFSTTMRTLSHEKTLVKMPLISSKISDAQRRYMAKHKPVNISNLTSK
jgi:hypothetical protein